MGKHSVSLKLLTITYFHNKESSLMSNKIGLGGCLINLLIPWRKKKNTFKKHIPEQDRHEYYPLILRVAFLYCAKKFRIFAQKFITSTLLSLNIISTKN